jgi:hypothetical protein
VAGACCNLWRLASALDCPASAQRGACRSNSSQLLVLVLCASLPGLPLADHSHPPVTATGGCGWWADHGRDGWLWLRSSAASTAAGVRGRRGCGATAGRWTPACSWRGGGAAAGRAGRCYPTGSHIKMRPLDILYPCWRPCKYPR